jgi:integrase
VDPNGIRKTGKTYATKMLADRALSKIMTAIEAGTYETELAIVEGDIDPKTVTLSELGRHWREERLNRQGRPLRDKTKLDYERYIESTLQTLADKPIRSITSGQISNWWKPVQKRAPRQANAAYKHLVTLYGYAVKKRWVTVNPCDIDGATTYTPRKQDAPPTEEQVQIMLDCVPELSTVPESFQTVIALAAWGGLRKGEIFALERQDIKTETLDGETRITVNISKAVEWVKGQQPKKGQTKWDTGNRSVILPPRIHDIVNRHLKSVAINPDALMFPRKPGVNEHWLEYQLNPHWRKVREQAGFTKRFHLLRTFALTQYGITGATLVELMERAGQSDVRTAMRYQRTTDREADLVRKMG